MSVARQGPSKKERGSSCLILSSTFRLFSWFPLITLGSPFVTFVSFCSKLICTAQDKPRDSFIEAKSLFEITLTWSH